MKRILSLLLAICMLMSLSTSVVAIDSLEETEIEMLNGKPRLSAMSEEECRALAVANNIPIPQAPCWQNLSIKAAFAHLEEDPLYGVEINVAELFKFYRAMRDFVKCYYGWSALDDQGASASVNSSTIQYGDLATVIRLLKKSSYFYLDASMENYNCYAYVLGRTDDSYAPGDFRNLNVTDAEKVYYNTGDCTIEEVADMVKSDLQIGLDYQCVKLQDDRPLSTNGWGNVIAVRKETQKKSYQDTPIGRVYFNDFHFAKLSGNTWYHKPGGTAVLTFSAAPDNDTDWISEWISSEYINGELYYEYGYNDEPVYDSDIKYISYKSEHGGTSTWTQNHYHSGSLHYYKYTLTCPDCGVTETAWKTLPCTGPNCVMPWSVGTGDVVS